MWILMIGVMLILAVAAGCWLFLRQRDGGPALDEPGPDLPGTIVLLVIGIFFTGAGVTGYATVVLTNCLTFDFTRPVYRDFKGKLFFANIIVPLLLGLGPGLVIGLLVRPLLEGFGLKPTMALYLPGLAMVALTQIVQLWVLIWAPVEKRLIMKRLMARGLSDAQLQAGLFVGISDAAKSSLRKFGGIEDDLGVLWVGPQQLIYWGDNDEFAFNRGDITLERRTDNASVTILGGVAHLILNVQAPEGASRQIRLHSEGYWTLGRSRRAMDAMAEAVTRWHETPVVPPPIPASTS